MSACEEYLKKLEMELPEKCTVKDLVKAGLYNCATAAVEARLLGDCPDYFQLRPHGRVFYPRDGVIQWLRGKINAKSSCKKLIYGQTAHIKELPIESRVSSSRGA